MTDIFVDHSTLSTFRMCQEKARLAYVEDLRSNTEGTAPAFGTAFHAALDAFYKCVHKCDRDEAIARAKMAFMSSARETRGVLPLAIDNVDDEKRSVERGLSLIDAYFERWKNETYESYIRPDTNEPYVEVGFATWLMQFQGCDVFYVGRIDRIMRSRVDGRLYNIETKTTGTGLSQFVKQVRPNHQVTGYHHAAREMIKVDIAGTVWDATFVSTRQPQDKSKDPWLRQGIDLEKDFARVVTQRSNIDIEEFLWDTCETTRRYLTMLNSGVTRWERDAPTACSMYGGCQFTRVCSANNNDAIKRNFYHQKKWEPWKDILKGDVK